MIVNVAKYKHKIKPKTTLAKETFQSKKLITPKFRRKYNEHIRKCNIYSIVLYDVENWPLRKVDEN
jgi:hypothetical protein